MYKLTDEYSDIDTFEGGSIPDEVFGVLSELEAQKKELRKEEHQRARQKFDSYKLKLNKI